MRAASTSATRIVDLVVPSGNSRGRNPGPLFVAIRRSGELDPHHRRLSPAAVYRALERRARRAGVAHLSPHDLRRTFVGDLLDKGVDLSTVQKMAGHASVNTTAGYDRRGERAKREAAQVLDVPYPATPATALRR